MTPKEQAELQQQIDALNAFLPPVVWQLYQSMRQQGFTDEQAFDLAKAWMVVTINKAGAQSEGRRYPFDLN